MVNKKEETDRLRIRRKFQTKFMMKKVLQKGAKDDSYLNFQWV